MNTNDVLYIGKTRVTGGPSGMARSDDGRLTIKLSASGSQQEGVNSEQLFGAGWSASFISAMEIAAAKMKIRLPADATVDAAVERCRTAAKGVFLQTQIRVTLPGMERSSAIDIVSAAHQICPYTKALTNNIAIRTSLAI